MIEVNHKLNGFFKIEQIAIIKTVNGVETEFQRGGIYCKDVKGLIQLLMEVREINPSNEEVLLGFDDGQGKFKCPVT